MARYTGNHCPVCEQEFTDNDDIVVCPDCGTPYHRACWQKVGACMHQSEHAAGFEWKPEVGAGAAEAAHAATCPNCGTHNTPGAVRCSHCGCPLPKAGEEAPGAAPQKPQDQGPIYARNPGDVNPGGAPRNDRAAPGPHIDTYSAGPDGIQRREIGPEDPIEGIKAKDWAAFVGRSPMYYLMQFFRMSETKQKVTLSLSAFLFGPAYLFYRKMWKQGVLFALLDFIVMLPSLLYLMAVSGAEWMVGMPFLRLIPTAMQVCYVLNFIQMAIRGLFAVYWYKKESERRIHRVYDRCPEGPQRSDALAATGGTSWAAVFIYLGVYIAAGVLGSFLMGPDLNAVIRFLTM